MLHNFESSLKDSFKHDADLDSYFSRWFNIQQVGSDFQRAGIDRIFTCKNTRRRFTVEYKSDSKAAETGNAFVESVSVDIDGKDGWALTCLAQYLAYYIPPQRTIYLIQVVDLKNALIFWREKYPERKSRNEKYNTLGILVPLQEFATCAEKTFVIPTSLRQVS